MPKLTKRAKATKELVNAAKSYSFNEAVAVFHDLNAKGLSPKFKESMEVAVNLGVDPRKSDQAVRGSIVLPKGTGKSVRIAVITSAGNIEAAKQAGADIVGAEDVAEQIKAGNIDFDMLLATPDAMRLVGQLGQILGPRGLMPNPKDGTVTPNIANAVRNAKMGQVRYRTDKAGVVHCLIGKTNFSAEDLTENFNAVMAALKKAKPVSAKGVYIKKITLSSTMGPGLTIDVASLA